MRTFRAPYISKKEIEAAALNFGSRHWKDKDYPIDVEKIAEINLRLNIIPVKNLLNEFEVDAFVSGDMRSITIDHDIYEYPVNENRRRFSISHELGHLVLHNHIYSSMNFASPSEWIETINEIPEDQYKFLEYHAYEFAGRLLVPRIELGTCLTTQREVIAMNKLNSRVEDQDALLSYVISRVAKEFKVSTEVVERRIRSDGLVLEEILRL